MKISRQWLNQLVEISDIDTLELADKLTNAGHEVESIDPLVIGTNLVIGHVLSCEDHPDSDHLHVCQVDVKDEILQIVCGAPNVAQGQKVIVAKVGAVLRDLTIKPTTIRGVDSSGMICSYKELALEEKYIPADQKEGIAVLDDEAIVGDDPIHFLGLDDEVMDIKQTPNRSDFMSMDAIALEVAAITKRPLIQQPVLSNSDLGHESSFVVNSETEGCPLFWAKEINHVQLKESPNWIKQALRGSGIHPINNLVDISNLVMLETGQPNHFYDRRFFEKDEITIVDNVSGSVEALDGSQYELQQGDIIISSNNTPIGIGGVMGLGNSMIQPDTTSIVVEVASFDPVSIRNTARRLGLSTDASTRFSKPMDPLSPQKAMDKILYYLKEYAGVNNDNISETVKFGEVDYKPHSVSVSLDEINHLLGTHIELEQAIDVFKRLHLNPSLVGNRISCKIPSYRRDLWIKEDLIEEVIRLLGYDLIESSYPHLELTEARPYTHAQSLIRQLEAKAIALNLNQVVSYTLVDKAKLKGESGIQILSPLSENREYVRDQLLPSMIETLQYNLDRKNLNQSYFELSQVYTPETSDWHLGIIGSGVYKGSDWGSKEIECNFYTIKGIVYELLEDCGINLNRLSVEALNHPSLHPYQSASLKLDNQVIGFIGVLHPELGIKKSMVAEINLEPLFKAKKAKTKYSVINKFPVMNRDIAIVVDKEVKSADLINTIKRAGKPYLKEVEVFDVFNMEDKKSLALSLTFESKERTLQDEEVSQAMNSILKALSESHQALLRS